MSRGTTYFEKSTKRHDATRCRKKTLYKWCREKAAHIEKGTKRYNATVRNAACSLVDDVRWNGLATDLSMMFRCVMTYRSCFVVWWRAGVTQTTASHFRDACSFHVVGPRGWSVGNSMSRSSSTSERRMDGWWIYRQTVHVINWYRQRTRCSRTVNHSHARTHALRVGTCNLNGLRVDSSALCPVNKPQSRVSSNLCS